MLESKDIPINWIRQFQMAYHSLQEHKLRSALSMLGIIFGIISVVTMLSVGEGAKRKTLEQIEQLGIQNIILKTMKLTEAQQLHASERLSHGLSERDVLRIRESFLFVEFVAPLKEVRASVLSVGQEFYPDILAISAEYQLVHDLAVSEGRFISALDSSRRNFVCVIGDEIAGILGAVGRVSEVIRIEEEIFKIVGILKPRKTASQGSSVLGARDINRAIFIPLRTDTFVLDRPEPLPFDEIVVKVRDKDQIFSAANGIQELMESSHQGARDYQMIIPQELINKQKQTQTNFNIFLGSIAIISLMVGGIGIMNIMLANVSERTHEIGIRRALGATQNHIKWQFLSESILVSVSGGVIGLFLGLITVLVISFFGEWRAVVNAGILILALIMAFAVGLFSGLYPAVKASKMDPVEALRYE